MKVAITGANGFLGKNLVLALTERTDWTLVRVAHDLDPSSLVALIRNADVVVHLAGVNRPRTSDEFRSGNFGFTQTLCEAIEASNSVKVIVYASSTQARGDSEYGASKRLAEDRLLQAGNHVGSKVYIYRYPNVFGKWARPHYNSAVATFCHNIARGEPITVNDPDAPLSLCYIDDLVDELHRDLSELPRPTVPMPVGTAYETTVGELAGMITALHESRQSLVTEPVGHGLLRALQATYLSHLPRDAFSYAIPTHCDERGVFAEVLKTKDSGQFSFFTAHPGVTRGGHYHHSKVEKFLIVKGRARFDFRDLDTGDTVTIETSDTQPRVVETIPGWVHAVTNVGDDEMIAMLWANEIFDRQRPDTFTHAL